MINILKSKLFHNLLIATEWTENGQRILCSVDKSPHRIYLPLTTIQRIRAMKAKDAKRATQRRKPRNTPRLPSHRISDIKASSSEDQAKVQEQIVAISGGTARNNSSFMSKVRKALRLNRQED